MYVVWQLKGCASRFVTNNVPLSLVYVSGEELGDAIPTFRTSAIVWPGVPIQALGCDARLGVRILVGRSEMGVPA